MLNNLKLVDLHVDLVVAGLSSKGLIEYTKICFHQQIIRW